MHDAVLESYKHVEEMIEDTLALVCFIESTKGPRIKYSLVSTMVGQVMGKPPKVASPPEFLRNMGLSTASRKIYVFDRYGDGSLREVKTFNPNRMEKIRLVKLDRAIGLVFRYKGKDHQYKLLEYPLSWDTKASEEEILTFKKMARQIAGLLKEFAKQLAAGNNVEPTNSLHEGHFSTRAPESAFGTQIPTGTNAGTNAGNHADGTGTGQAAAAAGLPPVPSIPPPPSFERIITRDGKRPQSPSHQGTETGDGEEQTGGGNSNDDQGSNNAA